MENTNLKQTLFVVVPVFNEVETVDDFIKTFDRQFDFDVVRGYDVDIVFVDDGSIDETLSRIKTYKGRYNRLKIDYVSFSKNYGKECAFLAGFNFVRRQSKSSNDLVAIMDVDLQDRPENLSLMISRLTSNSRLDRVYAVERRRDKESKFHKFCALSFYKVFSFLTGLKKLKGGSRDFSVFRMSFLKALLNDNNPRRFFKGLVLKVGFNEEEFKVMSLVREKGTSKFNFKKLLKYAVTGINASSDVLFYLPSCLVSFIAFILFIYGFTLATWLGLLFFIIFLFSLNFVFITYLILKNNKENRAIHNFPYNVKESSEESDD